MTREIKLPHHVQLRLSNSLAEGIDNWRRIQRDIPSRSEAIRRLTATGIQAEPILKDLLAFLEMHGDPDDAETRANVERLRGIVSE